MTVYTRKDFTPEFVTKLLHEHHGEIDPAARSIHQQCRTIRGEVASQRTIERWMRFACGNKRTRMESVPLFRPDEAEAANKFVRMLRDMNLDPKVIIDGEIKIDGGHYKSHGVFAKVKQLDGSEKIETKSLYSIGVHLTPSWEKGPSFPLIQACEPVRVKYNPPIKADKRPVETVVFIPDMHVGFVRVINSDEVLPTHDLAAIDVAMQIVADLQPTRMFNLGDSIDLPELSQYEKHPEHDRTTQQSLYELRDILAGFESAAGPIERRKTTLMHGGNHGNRIARFALGHNKAAYGIRRAEDPRGWPVLSLPYLVGTDSLGIEYVGDKIGAEHWLTDDLKVVHEPPEGKVQDPVNIVCAHDHHIWQRNHTVFTKGRHEWFTVYGMGCLARVEPYEDKTSLLAHYVPGNYQKQRWQHCVGVCYIKNGQHYVEQVHIRHGAALFRGKSYVGRTTAPWRKK